MNKKKTIEDFINEARKVHGNKYNYSDAVYIDNKTKICIICPEHGIYWQKPYKHLHGQGCPICSGTVKSNNNNFIKKAKSIHGDKYDYSKVEYVNNKTKVCIICPEHGEFWQDPHNHLKGKGCPECGKKITKTGYDTTTFIKKAISIWGNTYDYSKVKYSSIKEKICITCPEHGEFWQEAESHLQGCGCPKCGQIKKGLQRRSTKDEFIQKAQEVHGDKYDYSKVEYITAKHKVCIICPQHGEFWQSPYHHLSGCGCPKCVTPYSKNESEIYEFVKDILPEYNIEQHNRNILDGKEIDIYIPKLKVGIEYNGLYWHNSKIVDKNYHIDKLNAAKHKDIQLIQIFEDEYVNHKEIVLEKIRHILKRCENKPKIMARKCEIKEINQAIAKDFLDKNHIQGFVRSTLYIGAFYNGELIAVMTFKKEETPNYWELTRCSSNINYICPGMGGKLFKYFIKTYNPKYIKSFADRRWTINEESNLYTNLGFNFEYYTKPDYRYYNPHDGCIRQHKFKFRKDTLHKKYGLSLELTETQMIQQLGYERIWDCGLIKYIWNK